MKALVYQGINDLVWETYSDPVCEDGGIVIEVQACGLCGSDMRNIQYGHHSLKPSQVIGHEVVGIVIESRNEDFAVGDWIVVSPPIPCGLCEFCLREFQTCAITALFQPPIREDLQKSWASLSVP